jgi:SAM-dependent methyltransferase
MKIKTKSWKDHKGELCESVESFDVIDCETCGFRHIIPIPTQEGLINVYKEDYYSKEKPLYLAESKEDLEWLKIGYRDLYSIFENLLDGERRSILEVGSGPGYFLLYGRERGWQVKGIEPASKAAAHGKKLGLDIEEDFLTTDNASTLGSFDVIYLDKVLEHIPDPRQMLTLTHNMLNEKGLLCVKVPNDYSLFQKIVIKAYGLRSWWVAPPHHINYFDFQSLTNLFEDIGFEIVHRTTSFPMDIFLLMGVQYVDNNDLGRECHFKRVKLEMAFEKAEKETAKKRWYESMAELGIGREVILIGEKLD